MTDIMISTYRKKRREFEKLVFQRDEEQRLKQVEAQRREDALKAEAQLREDNLKKEVRRKEQEAQVMKEELEKLKQMLLQK
ncbi:hypothetical protein BDQ12DRAFT_694160 [Crucibulum laeve]|uniref:Uncharacterized protein n=1 Tax=Crucibulum laeve TaxID=68775 RepID=A0A5C3LEZ6_9AGAR|nr:hypothetical protein BDQ12DRAFT_694160 [Crucibulum laeve]